LKIIADENISFAQEAFSQFGNVELVHGRKITLQILKDADILIVRSITRVNKDLLDSTPVRFVGTATIGTDHIDLDYLKQKGITFTDAKGCNSDAVAEYVFTAVTKLAVQHFTDLEGKTIGVIGTGNIGSRIVRIAESFGMNVLKNDPPLQRETGSNDFVSLKEALTADVITIHVPLNLDGDDKTVYLLNESNLRLIKDDAILINAARGQVINNSDLIKFLRTNNVHTALDVWENEPDISIELLKQTEIATPHIAGYSLEGKVNGTKIIYDALCNFLGEEKKWHPHLPEVSSSRIEINNSGNITEDSAKIFNTIYDMGRDDSDMRKLINLPAAERPHHFDLLRKNYPLRREFSNYNVSIKSKDERLEKILGALRFGR